jgi:DedD protein
MGLTTIFQRKPGKKAAAEAAADAPADLVQQARTRARRRLIGAVVLVIIGVVGFPLLFETQPRPIPVDIPIEIPRKETAPPLVMPSTPKPIKPITQAPPEPAPASSVSEVTTETKAEAGRDVTSPPRPASTTEPAKPPSRPAPVVAKAPLEKEPARESAAKESAPKEASGRYVVQVGAFSDSAAARETRQKVEKLGLKTYTQVAETAQGSRIRVRIGPFASREEADRVLAKLKAAGSPAVVLTL